ncbi:MAG: phosphohistidine phosphatase SixA [Spirochaetota bacterium]
MKLYILRHGAAEDLSPEGDSGRRLTPDGAAKVGKMASFLKGKISPGLILSSPLIRARQTAEIAAEKLAYPVKNIVEAECLLPNCNVDDTIQELGSKNIDRLLIVGHNPHLSDLTAALISDGQVNVQLKKVAVACIDFETGLRRGSGILQWLFTAELI